VIRKLEHIGVAVKDLRSANELFTRLFGKAPYKTEPVAGESVETSFFMIGDTKVELLVATDERSSIAKFIEKRGEGIHHLAFDVDDIVAEAARLEKEGFELLNREPKIGADNKLICFLHPKSTNGVLIELCQERK
jgi:methylmalonyl-CoA/ethylmalonyl-CoA epimerase